MAESASAVSSSRNESMAIITALRKGHEELLKEALPKVNMPVFFAWSTVDAPLTVLKRASETGEMYLVHTGVAVTKPTKPTAGGPGPIPLSDDFGSANWKSESQIALNLTEKTAAEEVAAAGCLQFEGVKQPPFFAWTRLDEGIDVPPAAPALTEDAPAPEPVSSSEEVEDDKPSVRPSPMGLYKNATSATWKSEYAVMYPNLRVADMEPASHDEKVAGSSKQVMTEHPKYYAWGEGRKEIAASEYRENFAKFAAAEKPTIAKQSTDASLQGIFSYEGAGSSVTSEYLEKFVTKAPVPLVAPATIPVPTPVLEPQPEPQLGPAIVTITPTTAAQEQPSAPVTAVEPQTEWAEADEPVHRILSNAMDYQNAAQLFGKTNSAQPTSSAITKALYKSESSARYSWPGPAPEPANVPAPVRDLIGGAMQIVNAAPSESSELKEIISLSKAKMTTESRSVFAWPAKGVEIMNKRTKNRTAGGDLWVMGHKGKLLKSEESVAEVKGTAPEQVAEPTPALLDAMDQTFQQSHGQATENLPSLPAPSPLEHPVLPSKRIPDLREDPINPAIAYRNAPKHYFQPERPYLPTSLPARFPRPNPKHNMVHGAAQQRDLFPAEPKLDVVLAYRRYPALTDKQMNRWSTESKDQFVNKFKKR